MNFYTMANEELMIENPYGNKIEGEWKTSFISASYLNEHFGEYTTASEMKKATSSEGLHKFFEWLVAEGKLDE